MKAIRLDDIPRFCRRVWQFKCQYAGLGLRGGGLMLLFLMYWIVFKYIDPVGLESATKSASGQFFSAITEPFYGYGSHGRSQSHIAVVEISDDSLSYFGEAWPISYRHHAYLLKQILDAKPAAILVDIYFNGERQNDDLHALDGVLAQARQMHVPIFFVHGIPGDPTAMLPAPLTPYQVYSGWTGEKPGMYPLHVNVPGSREKTAPTAAFAMYSALCADQWRNLCHVDEAFEEPAFVRWGVYVDPVQKQVFNSSGGCVDATAGGASRVWRAVRTGVDALWGQWVPPRENACFYPLTMDAALLDGISPRTNRPYTDVLQGRAVFYGGDLAAMHDVVNAPAIGQVPGVQLHAMAFDNLLTYGQQYFHEAPEFIKTRYLSLDKAEMVELVLWMALSLSLVIKHLRTLGKNRTSSHTGHEQENRATEKESSRRGPTRKHDGITRHAVFSRTKIMAGALFCSVCCVLDLGSRHVFSPVLIGLYGFVFILIVLMPIEFETRTYLRKLRQVLCISAVAFCVNELFFHWPNTDWIGLALLWFTVPEVNEDNSPVQSMSNFCSSIWRRLVLRYERTKTFMNFGHNIGRDK